MSTIIKEGSLQFTFPNLWRVAKYDDSAFYRENVIPIAGDLAAVDFITVPHPGLNKILMIEVKDFRGHAADNEHRIVSGELVSEVIKKALHTLSGLYLASYCSNLADFVTDELKPPTKIELVLFMEEDSVRILHPKDTRGKLRVHNKNKRIEEMTVSLRQKLKNTVGIRSKVINTDIIKTRDGFTVTHI